MLSFSRAAVLVVLLTLGVQASTTYSPDDQILIDNAKAKATEYCDRAAAAPAIDYEKGRGQLERGQPIVNLLSESQSELLPRVWNYLLSTNFIAAQWPIILGFLALLAYSWCCWTACCACCRCCKRQKPASVIEKVIHVALVAVAFVGWVVIASLSFSGFQNVDDGITSTACASATLLKDLLAGDLEQNFIGLLPVVQTFQSLVAELEPGSSFLTGLQNTLTQTQDIEKSVTVVSATVKLLQEMMAVSDNVRPKGPASLDLMHKCTFCSELAPILNPVVDGLNKGVGTVLASARGEVKKQLDGPRVGELRSELQSAIDPMVAFKDTFAESVGFFVNPGGFDEFAPYFQGNGSPLFGLVMFATAVLFLILLCAFSSLGCWVCCEKRPKDGSGKKPLVRSGRLCAVCTWCNAMIYAITLLIFGGLLLLTYVPLSGGCLVMMGDQELWQDVMATFQMGGSSADMNIALNIADKCLSVKSASKYSGVSLNLLDMVTLTNSTGAQVTVREEVVTKAIDPVNAQFEAVTAKLTESPATLSNSADVMKLRAMLNTTPVSAMILPDMDQVSNSVLYRAMNDDPRTKVGLVTSMSCENFTTDAALGSVQALPGMKYYFDVLATMGTADPTSSCPSHNQKLTPLSCAGYAPCVAGNKFLTERKNVLAASARFRCDLFKHPSGIGDCDPKNMYESNGVWQNTCLDAQGRMQVQSRTCSLAEFQQYVQEFDERFAKTFLMLDKSVQSSLSGINSDMRSLVESHVIAPIYKVVENFECGFMRSFYAGLIDGVCFQGLGGYRAISSSYAAGALLSLMLAIVMYVVWRVMKDNNDTCQQKAPSGKVVPVVPEPISS